MLWRFYVAVLLGLCLMGQAFAGNWWEGFSLFPKHHSCGPAKNCACPTCPDDYCAKPCPPTCPAPGGFGPDDYCRKPCPIIPCLRYCGGPDDYCAKPCPDLLYPPCSPFLKCGNENCSQDKKCLRPPPVEKR